MTAADRTHDVPPICTCFDDPPSSTIWWRIGGGAFLAMNAMVLSVAANGSETTADERRALELAIAFVSATVFLLLGWEFLVATWRELRARRLSLEFLFLFGMGAAVAASWISYTRGVGGAYSDVAALLLVIYSLGREIGRYGQRRILDSIDQLAASRQTALRLDASGATEAVPVSRIVSGDRVRVLPGQLIPVDGVIRQGRAFLQEAGMTGESLAVARREGESVKAGCFALDGSLDIEATAAGAAELYQVRDTVLAGLARPGDQQRLALALLRWFVPAVAIAAVATYWFQASRTGWDQALFHALAVIVVTCPCALGFATPLAVWTGLARLRELGFLARSGDAIERLAEIDTVVFDKTGTLTAPEQYQVAWQIAPSWQDREPLLRALLREAEFASGHPLARALAPLWTSGDTAPGVTLQTIRIIAGAGIEADLDHAGSRYRLFAGVRTDRRLRLEVNGECAAEIEIGEVLHDAVAPMVVELENSGLGVYLSTGDQEERARAVPISRRMSAQTPLDKHRFVEGLDARHQHVLFVGDGLNDAAAMAWSHASVAAAHSPAAVRETADLLALQAGFAQLPAALNVARQTTALIRSNIRVSLAYNAIGVALAFAGWLHPVTAALLMTVSSLAVILRSMQLLEQKA